MTILTTTLIDDNFKTIIKASGVGNETEQLLVDASELSVSYTHLTLPTSDLV